MNKFENLIPDFVKALGPYVPGKPVRQAERESGVSCIKMASNENPFGPSLRALEAMRAAAAGAHLYPDAAVTDLRIRLAEHHRVNAEEILVSAGSTSFLTMIARTLLAPGLNAITSQRSFIIYPLVTHSTGARLIEVPTRDEGFDLDAILNAIDANTRVIFIANPNNPTGTLLTPEQLDRFMNQIPPHVCVVLDEAYADFAQYFADQRGVSYTHCLDYVRQQRNVVVLRTFSKAHGLAGARIGYGIAPADLLQFFARMKTVFSVSAMAEAGALAALEDEAHIRKSLDNNAAGAKWLSARLAEMGFHAIPTWTNFLYVDVREDAAAVGKRLQAEGVIIRPLSGAWGAPRAIRITIATPEQNEKLMQAMRKVFERAAVR